MFNQYKKKYGIYKLINLLNGKLYIGKSKNLFSRIQDHKYARSSCVIDRAIKLHGWSNFEVEILNYFDFLEKIELLALETAYIKYFQSLTTENGYNVCLFGSDRTGFSHSEKTKSKISKTKKGTMRGSANPFYGKTHSKEVIEKMRKDGKARGADWNKILIHQINLENGDIIKTWASAREACITLNRGKISSAICQVLKKKKYKKSAFGFGWKYA